MQPAVDLAKTFERRKCNHKEAIPGDECLTSVVGQRLCYHLPSITHAILKVQPINTDTSWLRNRNLSEPV